VHQLGVWVIGAMIAVSLRRSGGNDETRLGGGVMEYFVWMTTRKIRAGALDDFERVWQPDPYPKGLARAYAYWSEDGQEIIGVSFWDSKESCDAWRDSEAEKRRHQAMAPYVLEAQEVFYRGRELGIPGRQR
jgi:heme-degrading monooxygenase HmoA